MANYITTFGEIRGSIGGITFFRNRGGICIRMRAVPIQPNTPAQGLQQNIMSGLSTDWGGTLTPAQRGAWAFFADQHPVPNKVGQMIKLSGQQWFVKLNARLLTAGLAQINTPPVNLQVNPITVGEVSTATAGGIEIELEITPTLSATEYAYVFAAANVPPGVENVNKQRVFVGAVVGDGLTDFFAYDMPAKFGTLIAGNYVHAEAFRLNSVNGALSPGITSKLIIS